MMKRIKNTIPFASLALILCLGCAENKKKESNSPLYQEMNFTDSFFVSSLDFFKAKYYSNNASNTVAVFYENDPFNTRFTVSQISNRSFFTKKPASGYFKHNGVFYFIYTGIERLNTYDSASINAMIPMEVRFDESDGATFDPVTITFEKDVMRNKDTSYIITEMSNDYQRNKPLFYLYSRKM